MPSDPANKPGPIRRFRNWLNQGDGWWTYELERIPADVTGMFRRKPDEPERLPPPAEPAFETPVAPPIEPPEAAPELPPAEETPILPPVAELPPAVPAPEPETQLEVHPTPPPVIEPAPKPRFGDRLRSGIRKSRDWLTLDLFGSGQIDEDLLEELETRLLTADVGIEATTDIIDTLTERLKRKELSDADSLRTALRQQLLDLITPCEVPLEIDSSKSPFVILMVGVNGVGKTTTIGKLAKRFQDEGHSVMLAAGDTFRAAAVEQLKVWGERNDVPVVAQDTGSDAASVIFDALQSAQAKKIDVLIADTAGRLHTADNLMNELAKITRVIGKFDETAPHETMLVVDAVTGQNALQQAMQFQKTAGVTGLTVTKLDGTAKGGVMFAMAKRLGLPIRYIGVGEQAADLGTFQAEQFVDALLGETADVADAA